MGWDWVKILKEEMLDLKSDEHLSRHAATDRLAWVSSQAPARAPIPAGEWRDSGPRTPRAGGALLGWGDGDDLDPPVVERTGFNSGPLHGGTGQAPGTASAAPARAEVPPIGNFDFAMPTAPPLEYPMPGAPGGYPPGAMPPSLGSLPMVRRLRADAVRAAEPPSLVQSAPPRAEQLQPQQFQPGPQQFQPGPQQFQPESQQFQPESQQFQPESQHGQAEASGRHGAAQPGQVGAPSPGPFARPVDDGRLPDPLARPVSPVGYGSLPVSMRTPGPGAVNSGSYEALVPGDQGHVLTLIIDGVLAGVALPTGAEVTVGRERQSTLIVPEAKQTVSRRAVTLVRTARRSVEATIENRNGAWVTRQMPEGTRQEFIERGNSVTLRVGDRLALDPPGTVVVGLGEPH